MTPRRWIFVAVSTVFIAVSVAFIDAPVALFIAEHSTPHIKQIGSVLEEMGKSHWVLIYAAVVALLAWRSWRSVAHRHLALFTAVAASGIAANIIKVLVCRARPPLLISDGIYAAAPFTFSMDYLWNSFPSGHATTGIAIAIAGSATWPRLKELMWLVGLSIALGRIIYNVHFISDVVGGVLLGALISWWIVQRLSVLEGSPARDSQVNR